MKKNIIKIVFLLICMLSAVFCQAHPNGSNPNPHHFFDFIARDLKLNETQQSQLESVKSKLFETDRAMRETELSELETLVNMIETNAYGDEAIASFEKKSTENKIQFHTGKAQAMREFYNILDDNQKKMFTENMRQCKNVHNNYANKKHPGFAKGKPGKGMPVKGKPVKGRKAPPKKGQRFDKRGADRHHHHHESRSCCGDTGCCADDCCKDNDCCKDMDCSSDKCCCKDGSCCKGKDCSSDTCCKGAGCCDVGCCKSDKFSKAGPARGGKAHRHGPMHQKGGKKFGHVPPPAGQRPFFQVPLNKYSLLNRELIRDLYLSKEQSAAFFKIKEELAAKRKEVFADKCELPKDINEMMLSSNDTEQLRNIITENLSKSEVYNAFMLKKYFEFYSFLTQEQKNVLLLKYKYEIARMKLPKKNDR